MHYAGIGSRDTPYDVMALMSSIAKFLATKGYTLRSGGAQGADSAFELGCDQASGNKEIYLPWKGFNNNKSPLFSVEDLAAYELAEKYHPAWGRLSPAAKKLMARNGYQVLGWTLNAPVDFVICWTKDGKDSGGTGQAIRISRSLGIDVYNLHNASEKESLRTVLETMKTGR